MFIDTHAHLYARQFEHDRPAMLLRAQAAGVTGVYLPNIDSESIAPMLRLEESYPEYCFAMMGLHPCSVSDNYREELAIAREWLDQRPFRAIGEIGIDLYWGKTHVTQQQEAFATQLEWAKERGLPVSIHSRESMDMVLDMLRESHDERLRGVLHCFTGDRLQAETAIELGFYLGVGGVITYKNSGLRETLAEAPLERLLLETDAPYLAPAPHRGKRNESAYLTLIAATLAQTLRVSIETVGAVTTHNAMTLFATKDVAIAANSLEKPRISPRKPM
jgi:TatD DNase family protein